MIDPSLMAAILDSLKSPLLFADTTHVVRYMNKAAIAHYRGGDRLLGTSLLECHNAESQGLIVEILAAMEEGEHERLISESDERRVYMRAVRSPEGKLLGYYEWYEPRGD